MWDLQIIEYSDTFLPSFVYLCLSFLKTFHSSSQFDAKSSFRKSLQLFSTNSKSVQLLSQLKQTEKVMSKLSSSQLMTQVDLYSNLIDNLSSLHNYCALQNMTNFILNWTSQLKHFIVELEMRVPPIFSILKSIKLFQSILRTLDW